MKGTAQLAARPEALDLPVDETALIVVDLQNGYASPGGYRDLAGKDIGPGFVDQVGIIYKMSKTPGQIRRQAPPVGADTADVLKEIGYPASAIEALVKTIGTF